MTTAAVALHTAAVIAFLTFAVVFTFASVAHAAHEITSRAGHGDDEPVPGGSYRRVALLLGVLVVASAIACLASASPEDHPLLGVGVPAAALSGAVGWVAPRTAAGDWMARRRG